VGAVIVRGGVGRPYPIIYRTSDRVAGIVLGRLGLVGLRGLPGVPHDLLIAVVRLRGAILPLHLVDASPIFTKCGMVEGVGTQVNRGLALRARAEPNSASQIEPPRGRGVTLSPPAGAGAYPGEGGEAAGTVAICCVAKPLNKGIWR
jgi:hypothetical protein